VETLLHPRKLVSTYSGTIHRGLLASPVEEVFDLLATRPTPRIRSMELEPGDKLTPPGPAESAIDLGLEPHHQIGVLGAYDRLPCGLGPRDPVITWPHGSELVLGGSGLALSTSSAPGR
jgi:hypothetical protein